MKKFKSILALTASVLALSAFAAPVSAFADGFANDNDELEVTDTITGGYVVTIPSAVDFSSNATVGSKELKADKDGTYQNAILLNSGKVLNVYVKSTNGCQLTEANNSDVIDYTITTTDGTNAVGTAGTTPLSNGTANIKGDEGDTKGVLLATFENKQKDTVNLTFTEDSEDKANAAAGTYTDTLTFTISVDDE